MNNDVVNSWRSDLQRCIAPREAALGLPPAAYTSVDFLALERDKLLARSWVGVGRADRCTEPGSFSVVDTGAESVIIARDKEGRLRAFANVCRHRGTQLLEGEGRCDVVRCPFHRWTYALDGRLLTAPKMEAVPDFDKQDFGLLELRLEVRHGFAFVTSALATPDVDVWLEGFDALHAPWALDNLVTTRRTSVEVDCNWKLFIEVFNEYYHLPYVHPDSIGPAYLSPDPTELVAGAFTTQFGQTDANGGLLLEDQEHELPTIPGLGGRHRNGVRYTWIYPNTTFAASREMIWAYEVHPRGPSRCEATMWVCFTPAAVADPEFELKAQAYYRRLDVGLNEDIPVLVKQQQGLSSASACAGRFSPLEPSVANFAYWYAQKLTAHL